MQTTELTSTIQDSVVLPHHAEFEAARSVWNAAVDLHPTMIVRCRNTADVVAALATAREQDLLVAVRSGGHSPAGYGTCQAGMVIDLSSMKGIEVDAEQGTARIEPGLTWGEVAAVLQEYGLALTAGDTATVGVGGLALGGGIGWMTGKYGLTIDRLRAVELVTADGQILRASHDENPELFWGLRGGGHNFGIAVSFEFDLHPGGMIYGGAIFYEAENAGELLQAAAKLSQEAPEELTTQILIIQAPPAPFIPPQHQGKPVVGILMCYCGDLAEGERVTAPFRQLGPVVADLMGPMPYAALLSLAEQGTVRGLRHHCRTTFLDSLEPELTDALAREALAAMSPGLLIQLRTITGAARRVPQEETAFSHRDKPFLLLVSSFCPTSEGEAPAQEILTRIWNAVEAHSTGNYINFLGIHEADHVERSYSIESHQRLAALKHQYDPSNMFRRNGNIKPVCS